MAKSRSSLAERDKKLTNLNENSSQYTSENSDSMQQYNLYIC